MDGSPRFTLSRTDWHKIAKGFTLALAGAALAWATAEFVPMLQATADPRMLLLAALLSAIVNAARKWITDTR